MVSFWFRINDSFLGYPSHPITIPRSQVPYGEVAELLLVSRDVWISIDGFRPLHGRIYHGIAGWREYYQVQCDDPVLLLESQFGRGELARVSLFVADGRLEVQIQLANRPPSRSAA